MDSINDVVFERETLLGILSGEFDVHVRITTQEISFVKNYSDIYQGGKVLVVREKEGEEGQHYHMYVTGIKYQTLCSRIKKYFNGNRQYSAIKVRNPENQLTYLCKGTEISYPIVVENTLGVNVKLRWKKFWCDRKAFVDLVKKKKERNKDFKTQILEAVRDTKGELGSTYTSYRNIYLIILKLCREFDRLIPGDYQMIMYIEYVKVQEGDYELADKFARVMNKLKPNFMDM